jgi:hypothetical protein
MQLWQSNRPWKRTVPKPRLHLDADASIKVLQEALIARGHDVTRTPNEWIFRDASDETQLLEATAHGRCVFTFNVRDFVVLAAQASWTLSGLIAALDRLLSETQADDWVGQVRWLNDWRETGKRA